MSDEVGVLNNPTILSFLVAAMTGMAGFIVWLTKVVLDVMRESVSAMIEVKNAVNNNTTAFKENSEQTRDILEKVLEKVGN